MQTELHFISILVLTFYYLILEVQVGNSLFEHRSAVNILSLGVFIS